MHACAGQNVVVTGGASGIGAAAVRAFCHEGANVALLDVDAGKGKALEKELNEATTPLSKGRCSGVLCDRQWLRLRLYACRLMLSRFVDV